MNPKYCVRLTAPDGLVSYLSHRGRTSWSKRTAKRYAAEYVMAYAGTATIEPA